MIRVHYNPGTGAVMRAYHSSCGDGVPRPFIEVTYDAWNACANLVGNRVEGGRLIPGRKPTHAELGLLYSKLSIIRSLRAIPATVRDGVEGTLWDVLQQLLLEHNMTDEWNAAAFLEAADPQTAAAVEYFKSRYPDLDIDGILEGCQY